MVELVTLLKEIIEAAEEMGKAVEQCPRCGWEMSLFRKHKFLGFHWTCDACGISYPAMEESE